MLLIDCHEPSAITEAIKTSIPVSSIKLKYGDYVFSDVAIERKTLSDFFSSLKDGRLDEQLQNMSRHYSKRFLMIEGFFDFSYVNNIAFLYSKLAGFVLNFGVNILFSKDEEQTAELIKKIYLRKNLDYIKNTEKKDKAHHAAKFFGIGRKRLDILLSNLGSVRAVVNADTNQLIQIEGIGKKTAEKIINAADCNGF